ncbi:MAG: RsmE family RNA methyltransferase [Myxococcota bacterium]
MKRRLVLPAGALASRPAQVELDEAHVRHLRVLRQEPGAELEVTDGDGREAVGVLETLDKRGGKLRLHEVRSVSAPRPEIVLLQGVGKGEKLDLVTRQVGELGASRLVPVWTDRAVAQRENKLERLRGIADDALRVSRRAHRMQVDSPRPLAEGLASVASECKLAFIVGAELGFREALEAAASVERVALLVGPEGGLSTEEHAQVAAAGYRGVHLGPYVLRTETAGPAVVAMARFALGLA